jgi:cytidyltransferase-like protein
MSPLKTTETGKTVVVFGVFDLLHPGHLHFLEAAKRYGSRLVVVVTRDARVKDDKGRDPVFDEKERLLMVRALSIVDKAILGDSPGKYSVLGRVKPDIVALGHDQHVPKAVKAGPWRFVRLSAKMRTKYRTTNLRKALSEKGT